MLNKEKTITISLDEYNRLLESQKQVDELKKTIAIKEGYIDRVESEVVEWQFATKKTVKDTAKEIWNELYKKHTEVYNQYVFKKDSDYDDLETNAIINFSDSLYFEITKYFKEKYGVEVE